MITIAVLPGDGIGVEVTMAAIPIFKALNLPIELTFGDIGWSFWQNEGRVIPDRTWELIKGADATLLGATTSKPKREALNELAKRLQKDAPPYLSPIIQLRQQLDLFANLRPCFNIKGEGQDYNFLVIRENTEGLYAGFDYHPIPQEIEQLLAKHPSWQGIDNQDLSCSLRIQSKRGLIRLFEFAFQYALKHKLNRVTLADKPNVLRQSGDFARVFFEEQARQYPLIKADILNVDAVAMWMIKRPEEFGVIVAENMFGDILSEVGAGLMGGLGFAASANMGQHYCYFEPVHGSGPSMKLKSANPSAMFLTIALLLDYFGYKNEALRIKKAITKVVQENRFVTYDLGGKSSTEEMAKAIIGKT